MGAILIALLVALGAMGLVFVIDQRWLRAGTRGRAILAMIVAGVGAWTVTVIHTALWLEVPGAYGPVQYWHNAEGWMWFFQVRALTMFANFVTLVMLGPGVLVWAGIETFVTDRPGPRWRISVAPVLAACAFAAGFWTFVEYAFYPTA